MMLREMALACGLEESRKWGVPCYATGGRNVLLIGALKECATLSFLQGAALDDPHGLLEKPGAHSHIARVVRITSVEQIMTHREVLTGYIRQAIAHEQAGIRAARAAGPDPLPEEWVDMMAASPALKQAFFALTPGRQRGYAIYFAQPKQAPTRKARMERSIPRILAGKGLHDPEG